MVEAKDVSHHADDGLLQAKEYAQVLGVRFAYASNGHEILEFDLQTGELNEIYTFPSPEELWSRVNNLAAKSTESLLAPVRTNKQLRYYEENNHR